MVMSVMEEEGGSQEAGGVGSRGFSGETRGRPS